MGNARDEVFVYEGEREVTAVYIAPTVHYGVLRGRGTLSGEGPRGRGT